MRQRTIYLMQYSTHYRCLVYDTMINETKNTRIKDHKISLRRFAQLHTLLKSFKRYGGPRAGVSKYYIYNEE